MNKLFIKVLLLVITLSSLNCELFKTDDNEQEKNNNEFYSATNIYVFNDNTYISGYYWDEVEHHKDIFWKNGTIIDLETFLSELKEVINNQTIEVNDTYYHIYNGEIDTYTTGAGNPPYLTKNGIKQEMNLDQYGSVSAITIYDNTLYVWGTMGNYYPSYGEEAGEVYIPDNPCLWIGENLIEYNISDTPYDGQMNISVDNGQIYLTSTYWESKSCYWIGDTKFELSKPYSYVHDIFVIDEDVYLGGSYNKHQSNSTNFTACYWKNNVYIEVENSANGHGIFVDNDNNIYLCGSTGSVPVEYKACYWKNGVKYYLESPY